MNGFRRGNVRVEKHHEGCSKSIGSADTKRYKKHAQAFLGEWQREASKNLIKVRCFLSHVNVVDTYKVHGGQ